MATPSTGKIIKGERLAQMIAFVQELEIARKPHRKIVKALVEAHGITDYQARSVIKKTAEYWANTPNVDNARKQQHIEYLIDFATECRNNGFYATAARLMIEVGKMEGFYAPTVMRVIDDKENDPERARLQALIAKHEGNEREEK